ncbi:hypothetical protein IAD21_04125 [Abditibacteriota bacterium]|nr:hypothetical protein IAD21_04125 [Abditibacteriota bacterium]
MNIEQAERERIIRFYRSAQKIVREEVTNGYQLLHALGRTEQENREFWARYGASAQPQGAVLTRWERSLTLTHKAACRLLGIQPAGQKDFFPAFIKPSPANGWEDPEFCLTYPDFFLSYRDLLETEFDWEHKFEGRRERIEGNTVSEENVLEYRYRIFDWVIQPRVSMSGRYSRETAATDRANLTLEFNLYREDGPTTLKGNQSDRETLNSFTPSQFLGLVGEGWVVESDKQAQAYEPRFKQTIQFFQSVLQEALQDLNIND